MLWLDFETRSHVNLKNCGGYIYARDPSTQVICATYAFDDGPIKKWDALGGLKLPADLEAHFRHAAPRSIYCHSSFDRYIAHYVAYHDHGLPRGPLECWYDCAAQAAARGYPRGLEQLAVALNLPIEKDRRGGQLIRMMSIPPFENTPRLRREMLDYCAADVEVMRVATQKTEPLTDREYSVWLANERINDRGVQVDVEFAQRAISMAAGNKVDIDTHLKTLTNGAITTGRQFARIKKWFGVEGSFDKSVRAAMLEHVEPGTRRDVLELLQDAGKTSVAKYKAMVDRADEDDDRVRGSFLFAGGSTGRFASRGVQFHNMSRTSGDPALMVRNDLDAYQLASLVRPTLIGNFTGGDWSSIEARILPWLADTRGAHRRLDMFREGVDIYEVTGDDIRGDRQTGKITELALGFLGGRGALLGMAQAFGIEMSEARADDIVERWRAANAWAVRYGDTCLDAVDRAIRRCPGEFVPAGRVAYCYVDDTLICELPSGREIFYPRIRQGIDKFDRPVWTALKAARRPKVGEEWPSFDLWRGTLVENITQAVAADVLQELLLRLGDVVVAHIHDEVLCEGISEEELALAMEDRPLWALDLPLVAETWSGPRYKK